MSLNPSTNSLSERSFSHMYAGAFLPHINHVFFLMFPDVVLTILAALGQENATKCVIFHVCSLSFATSFSRDSGNSFNIDARAVLKLLA